MPSTFSTARRRQSPSRATAEELPVGRIVGCFGLRGELKCVPSAAARVLFVPGAEFRYTARAREGRARIEGVREHQGRLLLRLGGATDPDSASVFVGATLFAPKASVPLESGEFLDVDLLGCEVSGIEGRSYGVVERVEHYPASDMLVIGGKLVPMVDAIVRSIDIAHRRIVIDPPAGLLDENAL